MTTPKNLRRLAATLTLSGTALASACCPAPPATPSEPTYTVPNEPATCWILDWHNATQFDRTSELYGTWTWEDDGSTYGYAVTEDSPIWNTVDCALSDGDSGL